MPTGYTSKLHDGSQTFEEFALGCARAFGALIRLRDEDFTLPVPQEFVPERYHHDEWEKLQKELSDALSKSDKEWEKLANKSFQSANAYRAVQEAESYERSQRYTDMLGQVKTWNPPTSDHKELKEFMIEQLEKTVEFDTLGDYYERNPVTKMAPDDFRKKTIDDISARIDYHMKGWLKEIERTRQTNKWVSDLRNSL